MLQCCQSLPLLSANRSLLFAVAEGNRICIMQRSEALVFLRERDVLSFPLVFIIKHAEEHLESCMCFEFVRPLGTVYTLLACSGFPWMHWGHDRPSTH